MPTFVVESEIPGAGNLTCDELREIAQLSSRVLSKLGCEIRSFSEKRRFGIALLNGGPRMAGKRLQSISAVGFLLVSAVACSQTIALRPPQAEKIHVEREINGTVLVDDYAWLRQRTNPKVRAYLEAENAYAEQVTAGEKPFAEALYREALSHIKQTDISVPTRKHGYWYYTRTDEGKQYRCFAARRGR